MPDTEFQDVELLQTVAEPGRPIEERIVAANGLAERDRGVEVICGLIRTAHDRNTPPELLDAIGRSLGSICFHRAEDIDELDMANMVEPAGGAYDREIGRLQRLHPEVRMRRHRHAEA